MSNKNQDKALRVAAKNGNLEAAKQALNNGANINAKLPLWNGYTPLHYASWKGHVDVVSWLLEKGANVNVTNDHGDMPLHYACLYGHETICSLLLQQNGANKTFNATNKRGDTPLHNASYMGHASICTLLLQNGANPSITNKGKTPLQLAQERNKHNCVDVINQSRQNAPSVPTSPSMAIAPSNNPLEKKLAKLNKKRKRRVEAAHIAKDLEQDDKAAAIYSEIEEIEREIEEIHDELD